MSCCRGCWVLLLRGLVPELHVIWPSCIPQSPDFLPCPTVSHPVEYHPKEQIPPPPFCIMWQKREQLWNPLASPGSFGKDACKRGSVIPPPKYHMTGISVLTVAMLTMVEFLVVMERSCPALHLSSGQLLVVDRCSLSWLAKPELRFLLRSAWL